MYNYKVFLWQNGAKGEDLTEFLTSPTFYEDRLNEELDTAEIILDNMPLSTRNKFVPKTKFRIERYKTKALTDLPKKWDMLVEHDDVEEYVGLNKCCHRISLIEPSVVAQGMHIDNIALTYELQDVSLNYKTYTQNLDKINDFLVVQEDGNGEAIKEPSNSSKAFGFKGSYDYFRNSYFYKWSNLDSLKGLYLSLPANQQNVVNFTIPTLTCQGCPNGGSFEDLFEMNTITKISRVENINGVPVEGAAEELLAEIEQGALSFTAANNSACNISGDSASLRTILSANKNTNSKDNFTNYYYVTPIVAKSSSSYGEAKTFSGTNFSCSINGKQVSLTLPALTQVELNAGKSYTYKIKCVAKLANNVAKIYKYMSYKCHSLAYDSGGNGPAIGITMVYNISITNDKLTAVDPNTLLCEATFDVKDTSSNAVGGPMLTKGKPYYCYNLLQKALLTIDTQIINNENEGIESLDYPIVVLNDVEEDWKTRLQTCKVQETILENKNLWEVLLQIGYYLHAIPYLSFAEDGTDRFVLSFKQLGDVKRRNDTSTKITVFNSCNLNNYFVQYDSYLTNLFSPQNLVDEWLTVKTNDSSCLISNNTAILKTVYGISEIVDFEITYDGSAGGTAGTEKAISHIFEKSIYEILTSEFNVSPGKGDSLFYTLGSNTIEGLTYTAPSKSDPMPMALKRIVSKLFSGVDADNLKFNNLKFHIKYRTQDNMRLTQVRPNLKDFMKNSSYEKYPHHEQFYGQQDKIIDSERFSKNLFGKLVRVGNDIYQRQEKVVNDLDEKESGDLVEINGEAYYVTEVENEFYPDATFQKVTYSKNFNQLSNIVTIPSEPRFYEVSERSKIRREKREFDFLEISTIEPINVGQPTFLNSGTWQSFIKGLIFNKESITLPNYAWVRFQADKFRQHKNSYGQNIPLNQMFPSVEIDRTDPLKVAPKSSSDHADCIVPLLHFPLHDGIIFEFDMEDNFKAGDSIDTTISGKEDVADDAYYAMQAVRYCDIMGRADLYAFRLFNKNNWTHAQAQALPKACIEPSISDCSAASPANKFIALDKDCREELSFNYQICLLHRNDDEQGDFVTFSNIFGNKDGELKCCLLDEEVSMFNENVAVIPATVLADNVAYSFVEDYTKGYLKIQLTKPPNLDATKVKSIVFYEVDSQNNKVAYLAKNFKNGLVDNLPSFFVYPVFN